MWFRHSYLSRFRNVAFGDSTGSNWIKKDRIHLPPRLVWGKRGEGLVWFSVREAPLDDWANGCLVDVFFTYTEYCFSSMGSWYYSREWVWKWKTKLCCIVSGKWNVIRVSLQEFDIKYILFSDNLSSVYQWSDGQQMRIWLQRFEINFREGRIRIRFSILILWTFF